MYMLYTSPNSHRFRGSPYQIGRNYDNERKKLEKSKSIQNLTETTQFTTRSNFYKKILQTKSIIKLNQLLLSQSLIIEKIKGSATSRPYTPNINQFNTKMLGHQTKNIEEKNPIKSIEITKKNQNIYKMNLPFKRLY